MALSQIPHNFRQDALHVHIRSIDLDRVFRLYDDDGLDRRLLAFKVAGVVGVDFKSRLQSALIPFPSILYTAAPRAQKRLP